MFLDFAHSSAFAIRDLPIPFYEMSLIDFASSFELCEKLFFVKYYSFFQVYNFILVSARKGLTNEYLSSIFDNIIIYLSSIVDKKIVIDGYYKRQDNKKRRL